MLLSIGVVIKSQYNQLYPLNFAVPAVTFRWCLILSAQSGSSTRALTGWFLFSICPVPVAHFPIRTDYRCDEMAGNVTYINIHIIWVTLELLLYLTRSSFHIPL